MNEMFERVAAVLAKTSLFEGREHLALSVARDVIESMREPTEEMIERTAMKGEGPMITAGASRARIPHYWRSMIDEALK